MVIVLRAHRQPASCPKRWARQERSKKISRVNARRITQLLKPAFKRQGFVAACQAPHANAIHMIGGISFDICVKVIVQKSVGQGTGVLLLSKRSYLNRVTGRLFHADLTQRTRHGRHRHWNRRMLYIVRLMRVRMLFKNSFFKICGAIITQLRRQFIQAIQEIGRLVALCIFIQRFFVKLISRRVLIFKIVSIGGG